MMAAKTKPKAKKVRKPKQAFLPDMSPPRIRAIDDAADIYYERKKERVSLTNAEKDAKVNLIELMIANNLTVYETPDGLKVEVTSKSNCKCKRKEDSDDENDGDPANE